VTSFKQNEIVWLSILQGFTIFLVVVGYSLCKTQIIKKVLVVEYREVINAKL